MLRKIGLLCSLAFVLGAFACDEDDETSSTITTVDDVTVDDGRFTTLEAALKETGLDATLRGDGPFTLFAPTDEAFNTLMSVLGISTQELLDLPNLADILRYHVVSGSALDAAAVTGSAPGAAGTVEGSNLQYSVRGSTVFLDGAAAVIQADITADNGVIHAIDSVLFPPGAFPGTIPERLQIAPAFSALVNAAVTATLPGGTTTVAEALGGDGPFTVFAPHDDAFAALDAAPTGDGLTDTLLYHAVSGDKNAADVLAATTLPSLLNNGAPVAINGVDVTFGGADLSAVNLSASNGTIHVIDAVVAAPDDIATIAADSGFDSLVTALGALELTGVFQDEVGGQDGALYTVFAPTDKAFDALLEAFGASGDLTAGAAALGGLGWPLVQILSHHVLVGVVDSAGAAAAAGTSVDTLVSGDDHSAALDISAIDDSLVLMGNARITFTDIVARNGIIHVIDAVVFPRETNLNRDYPGTMAQLVQASPLFSTLLTAVTDDDAAPAILTNLADAEQTLTLFGPTNGAFAKVPSEALTGLLDDADALSNTLLYHALGSVVLSESVTTGEVTTLVDALGDPSSFDATIDVTVSEGTVTLETTATGDAATVVYADIETSNGVIHVIDEVLLPATL